MIHLLDDYLALRRAAGFKLKGAECRLRRFVRFAEERGDTHVRVDTAVAWAGTGRSPHERYVRLQELAIFARHLRAEDARHEVPPPQVFAFKRHKRLPHIYSDEDIRKLMAAAGKRHRRPGDSISDTYRTLLGLIAATGIRVGEAINLCMRDISELALFIRETKFRKSRMIPLHETVAAQIATYADQWRVTASPEDPFFVSIFGRRLCRAQVNKVFRQLTDELGLTLPAEEGRCLGPRIHDLRHTFAVRALESCPEGRSEINKHMVALSTYLGHASTESTYWYLHVTPQLMTDIADACEAWFVRGAP
jgi:integrase/recombinase XerD